ncbi:MAG TPA: PilZ domain-containing protein [Kofleriaceae bacterium]|nr:PilZ domain-containing protein [Kofleriaceae bacterium]
MQPRGIPPLVEAYLLIERPRQRLGHWLTALAPLDDGRAPPLASVTAYYDDHCDQAVVGLCYDELALGRERLAFVVEVALLAEIGMVQPAELSEADRTRFAGDRLARCTIRVGDQRSVCSALSELVRKVRDHKLKTPPPIPVDAQPAPYLAKGTRDDVRRAEGSASGQYAIHRRTPSANVVPRSPDPHRASTVELSPIETHRIACELRDPEPEPLPARAGSPSIASELELPTPSGPTPPGIIYARYLRSGRWVPIRIGALSLRGAALMTGALPRLHDHVDVALSYAGHRALVRGPVKKVSSVQEAAQTGAASFSVAFELDDSARRQLTNLLTAARAAQVTIKPPPPRHAQRYPVEWPVCLGTMRGAVRGEALDVSRDGMFVRPVHALALDSALNFSAVLDDGGAPISGRARVVRQVVEAEARSCGLTPGYGLRITDMGDDDLTRWSAFLVRIERRAEKRVLVGASPNRLPDLQSALSCLGYAVTGGTDPGALVQLAGAERPVDAVLMDGGWLTPGSSMAWIESLFSARNVPCVTIHGDAKRGRMAIDKLLAIA